jgi:hypothetical protein
MDSEKHFDEVNRKILWNFPGRRKKGYPQHPIKGLHKFMHKIKWLHIPKGN